MKDEEKSKKQLITELEELRQRILELKETSFEDTKKELDSVSIELAISLSEVFDALRKISSGDPDVIIPEESEVELISLLKHMVNITSQNIREIVDQSHEFAMVLAEHFDVLNRVSKGDLSARVCGESKGELLEALKKISNETIESIDREIAERKRAEEQLLESGSTFRSFAEQALVGIYLIQDGLFKYINPKFAQMFGYTFEECLDLPFKNLVYAEDLPIVEEQIRRRILGEVQFVHYTFRGLKKNGVLFNVEIYGSTCVYRGKLAATGTLLDITERKQAEDELKTRDKDLEMKTKDLEEINTALNVLLKKREEDKTALEEKVLSNIQQLVEPYMLKLKQSGLDKRQKVLAAILESNLKDITSSFTYNLSSRHLNLTPRQVKIANLITQDKSSKEICEILGSSEKMVAFHRQNIRRKLGLQNKKVNLKSYLIAKNLK